MMKESDRHLIELCMECRDMCAHWLENHKDHSSPDTKDECSRLILECFDACSYTVTSLQRDTPFSKEVCQLCELICEACGNECSTIAKDSGYHNLAEKCYEVADRCRQRIY
jgi:hypothetical protein